MSKGQHVLTPPGMQWKKLKIGEWLVMPHGPKVYNNGVAYTILTEALTEDHTTSGHGVLWRLEAVKD